MKTDLLTITMPVFERKEFFEAALNSVLNQTVKCEILVIDNCSSHDFFERITKEKNVRYIRNESNIGLFPNWNKCMQSVDTEYSMIFQDDNVMDPTFVENFVDSKKKHDDIDLYFTNFNIIDLETRKISNHGHEFPYGYYGNGQKVIEYGINKKLGFPYAFVIRTNLFTSYYCECHGSNDWVWLYGNIKEMKVFGNSNMLFSYGSHPNQDSKSNDTHMKCMISISYIYDEILSDKVEQPKLSILASKRANAVFNYFIFYVVTPAFLNELQNEDHIYATYFRKKLLPNQFYRIVAKIPLFLRKNLYRIGIRTGFIDKV